MRWVRIPWAPHQTKCSKYSNDCYYTFTKDVRFNFYWTLMPPTMSEGTNLNYFTHFTYFTYLTYLTHSLLPVFIHNH